MQALSGTLGERAGAALKAGCDIALHCNGDLKEMQQIAGAVGRLKGQAKRRADAALGRIVCEVEPLDVDVARAQFAALLAGKLDAKRGPDVGEAQA